MIPITDSLLFAAFAAGIASGRLDGTGAPPAIDGDLVARLAPDASGAALGDLTGRAIFGANDFGAGLPGLRGINGDSLSSDSTTPALNSFSLIAVMRPIGPVVPVEQWGVWAGGGYPGYVRRMDDRGAGPVSFASRLGFRLGSLGNTLGGGLLCEGQTGGGSFLTADSGPHVVALRRDTSLPTGNQVLWLDGPARSATSTVHAETLNAGAVHLVGSGPYGGAATGLSVASVLLYSVALVDADLSTLLAFLASKYPSLHIS